MALDRLTIITSSGLSTVSDYVIDGLRAVGVVTASTVQVGSATTVHTTGVDLGSGNITSHNINSTGIITATGVTVTGDLTVEGTLAYDDVTNIDSVGLGTFRNGLHIIDSNVAIGHSNPTYMLHLKKHGNNEIVLNNTRGSSLGGFGLYDNHLEVNALSNHPLLLKTNSVERLRITSDGKIVTSGGAAVGTVTLAGDGKDMVFGRTYNSGTGGVGRLVATGNIVYLQAGENASSGSAADLVFGNYGGVGERLRITSGGDMGLGTATPTSFGPTFQVAGTDPALLLQDTATAVDYYGVNVASGAVNTWFDDAAAFTINTATAISGSGLIQRLRITSGGNIQVKGGNLHLDSNAELALFEDNTSGSYTNSAKIALDFSGNVARMRSSTNGSATIRPLAFYTGTTERLRINDNGRVSIGGVTSPLGALHIEANQGTDTALWIGDNSSSRYLAINEQSSSSSFNNVTTRYNDNSIHAHYILDNPYAQGTGYGSQILFRGNNQATTAYIETSNEASGSARGTLRLRGADNHGLDVRSTGEVTTTHASNIGYNSNAATNTRSLVYQSRDPQRQEPTASEWYTLKSFWPSKSGTVNMHAEMYIQSGTYYFSFRVREEGTNTIVFNAGDNGGYNAYATNGNAVHSYKIYKWVCPLIKAHKRYYIEMAATNAAGTAGPYTSVGQWMYLKNFTVYSMSPGHSGGTEAMQIGQPQDVSSAQANSGTTHFYMSPGVNRDSINVTQFFSGTESTFLGWFTTRAYNRYLDFELNMSGSYMWFAQAYGYLYSSGQVAGSMISGYTYSGNQILNKYSHTFGNRGWYGSYRTSSGNLCLKFDRGSNGYSEGRLALFLGTHGPTNPDWRVLQYRQNDTTNNIF